MSVQEHPEDKFCANIPGGIYLLKANNGNTRTICFSQTDFTHCFGVFIFDFEQVNADWDNKSVCKFVKSFRNGTSCLRIHTVNRPKKCRNCAFPQNFHTRKLGEIMVFFAVSLSLEKSTTSSSCYRVDVREKISKIFYNCDLLLWHICFFFVKHSNRPVVSGLKNFVKRKG